MKKGLSRRGFISGSAAAGLGAALIGGSKNSFAELPGFAEKIEKAHEKQFMDQYYDGALNIVKGIRDTQIENISKAMEKAYELKSKGGNIYSQVIYGHYAAWAGCKDVPGQPWVLPQSYVTPPKEDFAKMKKGDFLITNRIEDDTVEARAKGVFVVGITNNYYRFYKTPEGGLDPSRMKLILEKNADLVIDSQVPWDNGLVSAPKIPRFKLCPSTGIAQYSVYWACTAAMANLIGTKGKGSASDPAKKYLDMVYERFTMVGADRPKIDWISSKWCDMVLEKKARMLFYGYPQTVENYGKNNMFVSDAVGAASGSMIAGPYEAKANDLKNTDIVVVCGLTSNNPQEITVARHAKTTGALTTAFCPFGTDGDFSGDRLYKEVDYALNTYCDESAGVISVPGFGYKVSPISGLTGNLVLWMLTAQWTDHMARRGEMPYYWQGFHENGGGDYDNSVRPFFEKRGY